MLVALGVGGAGAGWTKLGLDSLVQPGGSTSRGILCSSRWVKWNRESRLERIISQSEAESL